MNNNTNKMHVAYPVLLGLMLAGGALAAGPVAKKAVPVPDWSTRAAWIGLDGVTNAVSAEGRRMPDGRPDPRVYLPPAYLRKAFAAGTVSRAVLRVTAEGAIVPYLNGARVGDDYFTPGKTCYHTRLYYRDYDVTGQMKNGANVLGAILGDGWFRGNLASWGQDRYGRKTRAKMELALTLKDGSYTNIDTDASWHAATGPILEGDMQAGEHYDTRLEMPGWAAPGFDDSKWASAAVGHPDFEPQIIERHPAPPVRVVAELPAKTLAEPVPGTFVFDFGQNFAGFARLTVKEPSGTRIVLRFAEEIQTNGMVYVENLRSARATDTYVCRGGGRETWSPLFTFHGFRYAEVTGLTKRPSLSDVTGCVLSTDMRRTGFFECSDPLVNRIYLNALWSQMSNYLDIPTDCPQRDERVGWTGDAQVFARTGLYNEDAAAFLSKWLRDVNDDQWDDGFYPESAPGRVFKWSPGWSDAGITVPYEIWRTTGDTSIIREYWNNMKRHLAAYRAAATDLIGPDFGHGDHMCIGRVTPKALVGTAYHAYDADLMSRMAAAIGEYGDAEAYRKSFGEIAAAFRKRFVTADGKLESDALTGYLLALQFKLLDSEQERRAAARLAAIVENEPTQMCGFIGVNQLLPALADIGRPDLAYRVLERKTYPGWGFCVAQGATTMWERWNGRTGPGRFSPPGMNSFNHYAYGSCVQWFYEGILGIRPGRPGFEEIEIRPEVGGGLTFAKGSYESVRGRIAVSWRVDGGRFALDVSVPSGASATVFLPSDAKTDSVPDGATPIQSSLADRLVFRVGSGNFRFQAVLPAAKADTPHDTASGGRPVQRLGTKTGPARGALVLSFDDRNFADWERAIPLFEKYNAHATFFVCGPIDAAAVRTMTALAGHGHSLGLHGLHHANADEAIAVQGTEAYFDGEIVPQLDACRKAHLCVTSFAYPNCRHSDRTDALFYAHGFRRVRGGRTDLVPYDPKGVKQAGRRPLATDDRAFFPVADLPCRRRLDTILIGEAYQTDIEDILACIRRVAQRKEVLVLTSHGIAPDAHSINMKTDWFEKILAEAQNWGVAVLGFDDLPSPRPAPETAPRPSSLQSRAAPRSASAPAPVCSSL